MKNNESLKDENRKVGEISRVAPKDLWNQHPKKSKKVVMHPRMI